jgi:hypothetical protein
VLTPFFGTCQDNQSGLISRRKLLYMLIADERQLVKKVADDGRRCMERLI